MKTGKFILTMFCLALLIFTQRESCSADSTNAPEFRIVTSFYPLYIATINIATFHEAFPYFAREFNLNIVAVVQRAKWRKQSN